MKKAPFLFRSGEAFLVNTDLAKVKARLMARRWSAKEPKTWREWKMRWLLYGSCWVTSGDLSCSIACKGSSALASMFNFRNMFEKLARLA